MSKDAKDQASPTKIEDKKAEQPWSDKERSIIVNHVLTHVLTTLGYGSAFSELPEILAKEGCPARPSRAYQDQWRRKICKNLLSIYGGKSPATPASPSKAAGPSKTAGSPPKRKRTLE
ncbi:hypothetical protein EX895_005502 [Sporisorium graminicola]|uniref:Uncharacterized protein n=1 Tax=Sporisorium graminicola TaxID=280036 RepID=A0A4U7KM69_9BASI|nr:hypothetical protein EX895_005502 [Sporisorium graminicola]TKY85340.1 hypothetical protein EX895_005502 [Sporisorium graminicola]